MSSEAYDDAHALYPRDPSLPPRYLGIDYGRKRIGIAVTDPLGMAAHPLTTIQNNGDQAAVLAEIGKIVREKDIVRIIVGSPTNMDGTSSGMSREVDGFARSLVRATRRVVETWDERLSSYDAENRLAESGMRWKERKKHVDQVAAALILTSWLDRQNEAIRREQRARERERERLEEGQPPADAP